MYESINPEHSLYSIYLFLKEDTMIKVGKLGEFSFRRGTYIYIGSAKKNMKARIDRHKKIHKNFHWHFDYLRPYGVITKIITYDESLGECELREKLWKLEGALYPVKGFGSSDCSCFSHLLYLPSH